MSTRGRSFTTNGVTWRVIWLTPGDPRLVDMTGTPRLGTTDPRSMTVSVRSDLVPPLLDRVVLHEVAHAISDSWGYHDVMGSCDPDETEELLAQIVERHAIEAARIAGDILGRPVCVRGECS